MAACPLPLPSSELRAACRAAGCAGSAPCVRSRLSLAGSTTYIVPNMQLATVSSLWMDGHMDMDTSGAGRGAGVGGGKPVEGLAPSRAGSRVPGKGK